MSKYVFFVAWLPMTLGAQTSPATYAGSATCATCHADQAASQIGSAHAAALSRTSEHSLAGSLPINRRLVRQPGYQFDFFRSDGALRVRIGSAADVMELPMEWAFGAGRQAVTFVTRVDKDWYLEHYSSYYAATGAWGPTPGQETLKAKSMAEAAGVLYKTTDPQSGVDGCFGCHSTGSLSFDAKGEVSVAETGVKCEACHGAGQEHARTPTTRNIGNPGRLSATELNQFCGRCHRQPGAVGATIDWSYAWNVRHQPLYLNESVCFQKSAGALSCLTCHDPHEAARQEAPSFYNSRCTGCHRASGSISSARLPAAVCLRKTPANCIDCHMPLVSPQAAMRFTNHRIGVYLDGAKLMPVR